MEAVAIYKIEVERAFSGLKECDRNALHLSPYAVTRGSQIFNISLAFSLNRALEKKPKSEAWASPRTKFGRR